MREVTAADPVTPIGSSALQTVSRNELDEDRCHSGGVVVLKIGQQISVAVKLYGSEGVEPM